MSSTTTTTTSSASVTQYGFFFDQSRCTGCQACAVACKDWNNLSSGPPKWLRIINYEYGAFPNVRVGMLFIPCFHCQNPPCVPAANGAMMKEATYGAVLIDPSMATSTALRQAAAACPYGAIGFNSDAYNATASKCTMCVDRLAIGQQPSCVMSCPVRALDFGTLSSLQKIYGTNANLTNLPSSSVTSPAVVFKASAPKTQVIPYNASEAIPLLAARNPLPQVFDPTTNFSSLQSLVKKSTPVIAPATNADVMYGSQNDNA
jgi:anaerobic dimethyl sulfoxide reductase subunit B (iron-sulfur subunit)